MLLTKHATWSYEKEWRGVHQHAGTRYGAHWRLLTGIYFGAAMSEGRRDILCHLLHGSPTKLYQMTRRDGDYEVTPSDPLNYKPYDYPEQG